MLVIRRLLPFVRSAGVIATALGAACSSSSSDEPAKPPPPALVGAAAPVPVYDGRVTVVPVVVRANDPATLVVTQTSAAVETELTVDAAAAADGDWHGTLRIRAGYTLVGGLGPTVDLTMVDGLGQTTTAVIALDVKKIGWQRRVTWDAANGPQTREHGVFLYDPEARAAYLLQGSGYSPQFQPIADSWRLDVVSGAWAPWEPTGDVPVAGGSRRAAHVPGTKTFYSFGGYIGFEATAKDDGDLYRIDLADGARTFTRLTPAGPAASARELHAVAYDAKGDQLIVFGGIMTKPFQDALDDTWTVKVAGRTATWTQLTTTRAPSPRYGSFTAFDAESRRFVIYSGAQLPDVETDPVNAAQDTWALDLSLDAPKWAKLAIEGETPKGRRNGCSMHDPVGRRLFVYGGTSDGKTTEKGLFVLDLEPGREKWTRLDLPSPPPLRSSGFGFATAEGDTTCAFGNDARGFLDVAFLGYER